MPEFKVDEEAIGVSGRRKGSDEREEEKRKERKEGYVHGY